MKNEYILAIIFGTATGVLLVVIVVLLHRLRNYRGKNIAKKTTERERKRKSTATTPTIIPSDIPGFIIPNCRPVMVQQPLRKTSVFGDDISPDEHELSALKPRNNNNVPGTTIIVSTQSTGDFERETSKMSTVSPLKAKSHAVVAGSISLQDLNTYPPKSKSRQSITEEDLVPSLKLALYYSVGTNELNVTVVSIHNLAQMANFCDEANVSVWVRVDFSRYHQEFRTKPCSCTSDAAFHETCVLTNFPAEHVSGSKISFRVIADDATVIAEAVHVVLGFPPSFPRNEIVELQLPGIVHTNHGAKSGEMLIRLKYDPVDEIVSLGIEECRDLRNPKRKNTKLLDTYIKVHIIYCDEIVQKQKSKLVQKSNNPKFQTRFNLSGFFSRAKMNRVLVKLIVVVKAVTEYKLAYVILGTEKQDSSSSGYQHWETIIDKPELDIAQWHTLKPMRSMTP